LKYRNTQETMKPLLRWMQAAMISLMVLIFAGAIVRATGSGLGCPDWPKCWACLIPPTSVEQVNFDKIDIKRFKAKAERAGRNPDEITRESLHMEFNPLHTWVEFINRLFALPMLLTTLVAFIMSLRIKRSGALVRSMTGLSLLTVLVNAWLGSRVVFSGLKPGVITAHLALAFLLMIFLVIGIVKARQILGHGRQPAGKGAFWSALAILLFLVIEGLAGAQLREVTDELAKENYGADRAEWSSQLHQMGAYYFHRAFSWSVLVGVIIFIWSIKKARGSFTILEGSMIFMVFALMIMGIILGHIGILPWIQVLHVGVAALLFYAVTYWVTSWILLDQDGSDNATLERNTMLS